jgi:hypothetical protein
MLKFLFAEIFHIEKGLLLLRCGNLIPTSHPRGSKFPHHSPAEMVV